jgi:hypothetical protein
LPIVSNIFDYKKDELVEVFAKQKQVHILQI